MRTLVIDTATHACSVALFDGDQLIGGTFEIIGRGHAERLLPLIGGFPDRGRAEQIAVNIGPGSFTGIRVGISAAKALALAWDIDCIGYSCLQLVAAMAIDLRPAFTSVDVVMNGGHGEYYFQNFDGLAVSSGDAMSLSPAGLLSRSTAMLLAGDVACDVTADNMNATRITVYPDARTWPLIKSFAPLAPSAAYVRPPDAKPMVAAL